VPESSVTGTENTRSEPICEFWHGTSNHPESPRPNPAVMKKEKHVMQYAIHIGLK
jgi:hypothetical protein